MSMSLLPILGKLADQANSGDSSSNPSAIVLSKKCQHYLGGLSKRINSNKLLSQDEAFVKYSGHITNELGYYQNCALVPNVTYHSCQVGVEVLRDTVGVCLSEDCSNDDWNSLQNWFFSLLTNSLIEQGPPKSLQADYMAAYFNPVYPNPNEKPLSDSYTMGFVSFLGVVVIATIYSTIKGKFKAYKPNKKASINIADKTSKPDKEESKFELAYQELHAQRYLDFFDLSLAIQKVKEYKIDSPGQLTCDLMRIVFAITTFMFVVPFSHGLVSKMTTDAVTDAYYNSPSGGRISQLIYFFPEGFFLTSGYVCTLAVRRAMIRWQTNISSRPAALLWLYLLLVLKRFLKLSFILGFGMILVWKILPLITTGPLSTSNMGCTDQNFFQSLFFWNNNIGGTNRMCGIWYWFYAANMRLYLFLPPIVFLSVKFKKVAVGLAILASVTSFVANFAYNQSNKIQEMHPNTGLWIVKVLGQARFHGLPYFLGVAWGLYDPLNPNRSKHCEAEVGQSSSNNNGGWMAQQPPLIEHTSSLKQPRVHQLGPAGISSRST